MSKFTGCWDNQNHKQPTGHFWSANNVADVVSASFLAFANDNNTHVVITVFKDKWNFSELSQVMLG